MSQDLWLGSNLIRDCDAALVVNEVEVFRLRERAGDGRLVVDFEVRDEEGNLIAKIAKNNAVYCADDFEAVNEAQQSYVKNKETGVIVAKAEDLPDLSVRVTGDFWIEDRHVQISEDEMRIGGIILSGNELSGMGKAFNISPDSFGIGGA